MEAYDLDKFNLSIAIDFGTDGIGIAYARGDIDNHDCWIQDEWDGAKYKAKLKPRCTVLLDENGKFVSFGLDAKNLYMNVETKKNKWMLFDRFKMSLYDCGSYTNDTEQKDSVDITDVLTATNGKQYPSEKVFVEVFQHLREETKGWLKKRHIEVWDNDIQWIITVPAIWNDNAKNKMMSWVVKAGLIDERVKNQCKIIYEPDCASLSMQYHIRKKHCDDEKMTFNFMKGDKYILVDAGGGTVDVACHEIVGNYQVKEMYHPSGGPWGSCFIDDQYCKLLERIFSKEWMDEFKSSEPNVYVEMIHEFQNPKETFVWQKNAKHHNVKLPYDLLQFMDDKLDDDNDYDNVEEKVDAVEIDGKQGIIKLEDETLEIDISIWKLMLFDPVINPSINHIKKLLNKPKMEHCKYLCLVGGLSCSPYFQSIVRAEFGDKLQIIIPERPILSVVEGASLFGLTENYMHSRLLFSTYGIETNMCLERDNKLIEPDYKIENKYFYCLAKTNQRVFCNEKITVHSKMNFQSLESEFVHMRVLCTYDEIPTKESQYMEIAVIDAQIDDDFKTEIHFYDTMVKIFVYPTDKRQKIQVQSVIPVCVAEVVQAEDDESEQKYDEIIIRSGEVDNPREFSVSRKAAYMSKLVLNVVEHEPNETEFIMKQVPGDTLELVVEYLLHHNGKEPAPLPCPVRSIHMSRIVTDQWDAIWIDAFDKKTIFEIILAANYMDIKSLLHLGCAKIATLIKQLSPKEINRIIEEEEKYRREHAQDNDQ